MSAANAARRPWRTRIVVVLASTLATLVLCELAVRWLLFHGPRSLAPRLRNPELFVAPGSDDAWKLELAFKPDEERRPAARADPLLGWACEFDGATYAHDEEARVGSRRPVLLFGDSFAQCCTGPEACFQALLEESDLGATHCLLNYGCGGYGLDQIMLAVDGAVERFRDRDPIVVVGIFVDDDLARTPLSVRGQPKPRFVLRNGALELSEPVETDPDRFLDLHPPDVRSYVYAMIARPFERASDPMVWDDVEMLALNAAVLDAVEDRLAARGVERFYLVFCGETTLWDGPRGSWAEQLVVDRLTARGAPFVSTRPFLERAVAGDELGLGRVFGTGPLQGHYNESGNLVAFAALRAGIERRFDADDPKSIAAVEALRRNGDLMRGSRARRNVDLFGRPCVMRTEPGFVGLRVEWISKGVPRRVLVRGSPEGPTEIEVPLERAARRIRARIVRVGDAPEGCARIELRAGDRTLFSAEPGPAPIELDVDVAGFHGARFLASSADAQCAEAWIALEDVRIE